MPCVKNINETNLFLAVENFHNANEIECSGRTFQNVPTNYVQVLVSRDHAIVAHYSQRNRVSIIRISQVMRKLS